MTAHTILPSRLQPRSFNSASSNDGAVEEVLSAVAREGSELLAHFERIHSPEQDTYYNKQGRKFFLLACSLVAIEAAILGYTNYSSSGADIGRVGMHAARGVGALVLSKLGIHYLRKPGLGHKSIGTALLTTGAAISAVTGMDIAHDLTGAEADALREAAEQAALKKQELIKSQMQGIDHDVTRLEADISAKDAAIQKQVAALADGKKGNDALAEAQARTLTADRESLIHQRTDLFAKKAALQEKWETLLQSKVEMTKPDATSQTFLDKLVENRDAYSIGLAFAVINPSAALSFEVSREHAARKVGAEDYIYGRKKKNETPHGYLGIDPQELQKLPDLQSKKLLPHLVASLKSPEVRRNSAVQLAQLMAQKAKGEDRERYKKAIAYLQTEEGIKRIEETFRPILEGLELADQSGKYNLKRKGPISLSMAGAQTANAKPV